MGWSYGQNADGKEVGYGVAAVCEEPGCPNSIDRGLAYKCGPMHGSGADYCDGYFCPVHLSMTGQGQRCPACASPIFSREDAEDAAKEPQL
jgi:hypothetical protein